MLDGISKANTDIIGFVIYSLFSGAIGNEDLKE